MTLKKELKLKKVKNIKFLKKIFMVQDQIKELMMKKKKMRKKNMKNIIKKLLIRSPKVLKENKIKNAKKIK